MLILSNEFFCFGIYRGGINMLSNNYTYQKEANISCLLEDREYQERRDCFLKILKEFEHESVRFGVACSFNLFLRGIVDEFHDFDLIVDVECIQAVKSIMNSLGATLVATGGNGFCESNVYLHYQLGRVDIDIISGFRVLTFGTQMLYDFNPDEVEYLHIYEEEELIIPLISLEALYLLYCMMEGWQPKRRYKRMLISEALETQKLIYPQIFEHFLQDALPGWVKREVRRLLENN